MDESIGKYGQRKQNETPTTTAIRPKMPMLNQAQMSCVRSVELYAKGTCESVTGRKNLVRMVVKESSARKGVRWQVAETRPEKALEGVERRIEREAGRGLWERF